MTPSQQLLAIAVGLYALECLIWPVANATLFVSFSLATWNIHRPRIQLFGGRRSVFLLSPLPPLGAHFVLARFPLAISDKGVCARDTTLGVDAATLLRPSDISSIQAVESEIRVNGGVFAHADAPNSARASTKFLAAWSGAKDEQRAEVIANQFVMMFDEDAAARRIAEVQRVLRPVRIFANALFVSLFVVAPALCYQISFARAWPFLLAIGGACWLATLIAYLLAYRTLYPKEKGSAWSHFMMMLFLPVAAIRACDFLSSHALMHFHPIVVARILCSEQAFRGHAVQTLRESRFQLGIGAEATQDAAADLRREFEARVSNAVVAYVESKGIPRAAAELPPIREDAASVGYCPRCHAQFAVDGAHCETCGELATVPFPADSLSANGALDLPREA